MFIFYRNHLRVETHSLQTMNSRRQPWAEDEDMRLLQIMIELSEGQFKAGAMVMDTSSCNQYGFW